MVLAGWLVGRSGVLGKSGGTAVTMVVFWVAMPCLLIHTLAERDMSHVLGQAFIVAAGSAAVTAALYAVIATGFLGQKGAERIVGAMSASYNNVANLGIPIIAATIGNPAVVVPALLFQIALYAPLSLTTLDLMTSRRGINLARILRTPFQNPMTIAAVVGLVLSQVPWSLPTLVAQPVGMLADAAVPMALLAFGISMHGQPVLRRGISPRRAVAVASTLKLTVHPFAAWAIGTAIGMSGQALMAAVIVAALPTAQNVFTYSTKYREHTAVATVQARDCGLLTSALVTPVVLLIVVLLGG
nr:AEC family transporter [Corynebacterium sp. TAE3-ERU12]